VLRAARISWKLDHPGTSTPLREFLALLIQISFLNTTLQKFFLKHLRHGLGFAAGDESARSCELQTSLVSPLVNSALILPPHSILQNFFFERARREQRVTSPFSTITRCAQSWIHPWRMAFPFSFHGPTLPTEQYLASTPAEQYRGSAAGLGGKVSDGRTRGFGR